MSTVFSRRTTWHTTASLMTHRLASIQHAISSQYYCSAAFSAASPTSPAGVVPDGTEQSVAFWYDITQWDRHHITSNDSAQPWRAFGQSTRRAGAHLKDDADMLLSLATSEAGPTSARRDHVTAAAMELHWLPVEARIQYKLCLLVHLAINNTGQAPLYISISNLLQSVSALPDRHTILRSATKSDLQVPRTHLKFGECAFSVAARKV